MLGNEGKEVVRDLIVEVQFMFQNIFPGDPWDGRDRKAGWYGGQCEKGCCKFPVKLKGSLNQGSGCEDTSDVNPQPFFPL